MQSKVPDRSKLNPKELAYLGCIGSVADPDSFSTDPDPGQKHIFSKAITKLWDKFLFSTKKVGILFLLSTKKSSFFFIKQGTFIWYHF